MNFEEFETYVPDKVDFRPALKAQVRRYGRNTPAARDNAARGPDGFVLWSAKGAIGFIRKLPNFPRDRDDQRDDPIGYYKGIVEDWSRSDKSRRGSRRLALAVLYWFFKEVSEPSYFKEIARHVWGHRTETFKRFIYAKCGGESDDSFKEISERFHAEIGVVEEAFPRFWIEEKPPFSLELPAKSTQIHHYTSSPIEILGREGEQEALERFRDSGPGFFWWQIAGVAGQGKSRLALDLVLKTREELPDWETGFLVDEDSVKSFAEECESWTPTRPYLILVDYVVGVAEFLRLAIQALAKRRQAFDVPVKLLIIERQPWRQAEGADRISLASTASWYAQLTVRRNGDDALLEEARYREDEEEFPNLIELKALEAHHLIDIVTQIAKRGDRPAVIDGEQIEKLLERIDGKGRPLFAYFLGRALGVGRIDVTEQAADLLDWVLDTDWRTRWKAQFGNDDEPPRVGDDPLPIKGSSESNPSMRLALLATMVRKIDCDAFEALQGWSKASTKIRRQALVICDRPIPLGPPPRVIEGLEPDILGSWFVLRSIRFGINAEWLTATAWQLDPKRMSEFLVRITQDFPAHPATLRLLATWPSGRHAKDAYAGVASALIRCFSQADRREPTPGYLDAKTAIARGIRRAAAMKSSDGMADYGVCLNQGYGFAKRAELGVRWLKYAADAGHSGAMASLGVCYERGDGVAQDMAAALDWYRKGAAAGHGGAMANLGLCYARGDGVEADMATALEWYRKGAAAGDGGAMACLGLCYELGDGVEADMATALEWYRKGAAAGDGRAMACLGLCYARGDGVEADMATALEWCRKGAAAGDGGAMANLGLCYARGDGVEADMATALEWCRKGAAAGEGGAMYALALYALTGAGTEGVDLEGAAQWARRALNAGSGLATKMLISIERCEPDFSSSMSTPEDQEAAQWLFEPLVPGDWEPISLDVTQNEMWTVWSFAVIAHRPRLKLRALRRCRLKFYPSLSLIEALFEDGDTLRIACILANDEVGILLNGILPPVHALNKLGYLDLSTSERCIDYLQFFYMAVCGEGGHVRIAKSPDPRWFQGNLEAHVLKRLAAKMTPPEVVHETDTTCTIKADVKHGDTLFRACFAITKYGEDTGTIQLLNNEALEEDLPLLWEGFDGPFRHRGAQPPR